MNYPDLFGDPGERFPRLSLELPGPRDPEHCQACGRAGAIDDNLVRWGECDDQDGLAAAPPIVVLCRSCSNRLIEPHPRLYHELERFRPVPGAMPLCVGCSYLEALRCKHPHLKANGGPGLQLTFPAPIEGFVCGRPHGRGGHFIDFTGPASKCAGRVVAHLEPEVRS